MSRTGDVSVASRISNSFETRDCRCWDFNQGNIQAAGSDMKHWCFCTFPQPRLYSVTGIKQFYTCLKLQNDRSPQFTVGNVNGPRN